jgi:hypothetical protein
VCYLSGPNLARDAAEKLKQWVRAGGALWLGAGAASRDEFNRPLHALDDLLPASRGDLNDLQRHTSSGRYLALLAAKDEAAWSGGTAEVLAVKQALTPHDGAVVLAKFKDASAALVSGAAGRGTIYCAGFLPGIAYIKRALEARNALEKKVAEGSALSASETSEAPLLERTANPWRFPAAIRELILTPVRSGGVTAPIECSAPLVDAVYMPHERGILIPLANYTAESIGRLSLKVEVPRRVIRAESVLRGRVAFTEISPRTVEFALPLENNDFVKLLFE